MSEEYWNTLTEVPALPLTWAALKTIPMCIGHADPHNSNCYNYSGTWSLWAYDDTRRWTINWIIKRLCDNDLMTTEIGQELAPYILGSKSE